MAVGAVKVEAVPGSGDIPPLDIATVLKLTHVTLTGNHHHSDRTASATPADASGWPRDLKTP